MAKRQARTAAEQAEWLRERSEQLLDLAITQAQTEGGDPASMFRAALDGLGRADVLEGGVSDRTGTVNEDPGAAARAEADRILGLIAKARGAAGNGNGANGHAKVVNGNGHAGNGHGEPAEH